MNFSSLRSSPLSHLSCSRSLFTTLNRRFYTTETTSPFSSPTIRSLLSANKDNTNNDNNTNKESVTVHGWVRSVRKQKQISFANINDGSCVKGLQAILNPEQAEK